MWNRNHQDNNTLILHWTLSRFPNSVCQNLGKQKSYRKFGKVEKHIHWNNFERTISQEDHAWISHVAEVRSRRVYSIRFAVHYGLLSTINIFVAIFYLDLNKHVCWIITFNMFAFFFILCAHLYFCICICVCSLELEGNVQDYVHSSPWRVLVITLIRLGSKGPLTAPQTLHVLSHKIFFEIS